MAHLDRPTFVVAVTLALGTALPAQALTERVSVGPDGRQANGDSFDAAVSADGRFVAFASEASNLVAGDSNGRTDVFVRDRLTGVTTRVSVGPGGRQANRGNFLTGSFEPAISADGRYVAFSSDATNLVPGDSNATIDVFVHDRLGRVTSRVSVGPHGREADADSRAPQLSAGGRFVTFSSSATNLVAGDVNQAGDIFVHDRRTGLTRRVSVAANGGLGGASHPSLAPISADGRYVAFTSASASLVPGDSNGNNDAFVADRRTGSIRRVSVGPGGSQAEEGNSFATGISADGRFVVFESQSCNLVPGDTSCASTYEVFVHDRRDHLTSRVSIAADGSEADAPSGGGSISADGRFVAFGSRATNLVANDTNELNDVFVRDRTTGATRRISVGRGGQADGESGSGPGAMSADGRVVAFISSASNLVAGDTNGRLDVFVRTP